MAVCVVSGVDRADLTAATTHHGLTFTAIVTREDAGLAQVVGRQT